MKHHNICLLILILTLVLGCSDTPITDPAITDAATNGPDQGVSIVNGKPIPPQPSLPLDLAGGPHVVATTFGGIYVYDYTGGTLVNTWSRTSSTNTYWGVGIGNVDGDTELELVAISRFLPKRRTVESTLDLEVYEQDSYGAYTAKYSLLPQDYTSALDLTIKDADNDGRQEILVGGRSSLQIWEYDPPNNKLHMSWEKVFPDSWNEFLRNVEINDADNDDRDDLLYSSVSGRVFRVYSGPTWTPSISSPTMPSGVVQVTVGDINNDDDNEVVCGLNDMTVRIFKYEEGEYALQYTSPNLGGYPDAIAVGDLDNDGHKELAVGILTGSTSDNKVIIYDCSIINSWVEEFSQNSGVGIHSFIAADCDGDGDLELFGASGGASSGITVFEYVGGSYQTTFTRTPVEVNDLFVK